MWVSNVMFILMAVMSSCEMGLGSAEPNTKSLNIYSHEWEWAIFIPVLAETGGFYFHAGDCGGFHAHGGRSGQFSLPCW